jgi:hypothetical protein
MALEGSPMTPLRIDELQPYTQLLAGAEGYIDPTELKVPIGHVSFSPQKAMYIPLVDFVAYGIEHSEIARVTGLISRTFIVVFGVEFDAIPVTSVLSVYRMVEIETNKWVRQDVQYYFNSANWLTATGFTLYIETAESLTGVVVEYKFNAA